MSRGCIEPSTIHRSGEGFLALQQPFTPPNGQTPNNPGFFIVKWTSSYIKENVLKEEWWAELLRGLIYCNKLNRGCLFELYVLYIFRKGRNTFEIKELLKIGKLKIPDKPTTKHFTVVLVDMTI